MGYRHQVISDTMVPTMGRLPRWFLDKYERIIDFDRDYWASRTEYKRYGMLSEFNEDVQKVVRELDLWIIQLVYFADEGENHDISHVKITAKHIDEVHWDERINT